MFQQFNSSKRIVSYTEISNLISEIPQTSPRWNEAYLSSLYKETPFIGLIKATDKNCVSGILIAHGVRFINPLILYERHVFIRRISVDRSNRGTGIGRALVREFAKILNAKKAEAAFPDRVGWQTNTKNDGSIRFFNRLGFYPCGEICVGNHKDLLFSYSIGEFTEKCCG